MNCERAKPLIPEHLAGSLAAGVRAALEAHFEECPACRDEQRSLGELWARMCLPDASLSPDADRRFQTLLEAYSAGLAQAKKADGPPFSLGEWLRPWWPTWPAWQLAMVLVLFGSGALAGWGLRPRGTEPGAAQGAEVAKLGQELRDLKEQMALALLEQKSVSERLRGVEWAARLKPPDAPMLSALLRALDSDPNVNVRLAVVEALQPYARQALVRNALLGALPRQAYPLVQVELIQLLVEMEDKESAPVLKSLLENEQTDATVRESAKWGLARLG